MPSGRAGGLSGRAGGFRSGGGRIVMSGGAAPSGSHGGMSSTLPAAGAVTAPLLSQAQSEAELQRRGLAESREEITSLGEEVAMRASTGGFKV